MYSTIDIGGNYMFYVYEWYIKNSGEIIYVGKGCRNRYRVTKHNRLFDEMIKRFSCESRIIQYFENEKEAFAYEYQRVNELKAIGQCVCNINKGGAGGTVGWWTDEWRAWYSENNVMRSENQRQRMALHNPMHIEEVKQKVASKKTKPVVINGEEYQSATIASKSLNVCVATIYAWCKRGYDTYGNECRYKNEHQKPVPHMKKTHPKAATYKAVRIDGIRFDTVKEGAEYIGVWSETLIKAIKASRKCKNHICEYDNQQPSHTNIDNSSMEGSTTNR